jgi:hypothetical protein
LSQKFSLWGTAEGGARPGLGRLQAIAIRTDDAARAAVLRLFALTWAVATLYHVWVTGRSHFILFQPRWEAGVHVVLAAAAIWVLRRPDQVHRLLVLAVVQVLTAWVEMPTTGNHWFLVSLVALGLLLAAASTWVADRSLDAAQIAGRFLPVARLTMLVCYGFAAFSKLNTGFFTPSRSCGTFFSGQLLHSYGLPALTASGIGAWVAIIGTIVIECSLPILLLVRRTRHFGVLVGLIFHGLLALNLINFFTDFSSALLALLLLFLPPSFAVWVGEWARERLDPRFAATIATTIAVTLSLILWAWPNPASYWWVSAAGVLLLWVPLTIAVTVMVAVFLWQHRPESALGMLQVTPRWLIVIPLLALANGLTPYVEVKTRTSLNMYSNLLTAGGHTNHLLIPRTWPLSDVQRHLVTVLDSNDPMLLWYADHRYRLPLQQLRIYTAHHPDSRLWYVLDGVTKDAPRIGSDPNLSKHVSGWRAKLQLFYPVPMDNPPRCNDTWGPAN